MNITDLNPHGGIGANSLFVEIGPFNLLIDAGMNPAEVGNDAIPDFDAIGNKVLDYIFLTHSHLDHLGALPVVARHHPQAKIVTSIPTSYIAGRMMLNSNSIMKKQREELKIPEYPLYTRSEILAIEDDFLALPYLKPRIFEKNGEKLEVTLYPSGHIPGAYGLMIVYKHRKIFFTGDVLFRDLNIIPGANFPEEELDTIVIETTRGSTERTETVKDELDHMIDTINHTIESGGNVLIPVFALGRMQELMFIFNERRRKGELIDAPIISSGLGMALVDIFDVVSRKSGLINFRKKILHDLKVKPLARNLNPGADLDTNGIFVVSSGMLVEHTPSYHVAASLLRHHHNSILFTGYCDPDTPGGRLLATNHEADFVFETLDYVCPASARIEKYDLSGHADRDEILDYTIKSSPRAIVVTHGDQESRDWFIDSLYENPITQRSKIIDPAPLERISV